ncbi:MAG TPA: acyl-CoA dehydrogenase family protein [Casimicrobiaceae bacterium]|jgi:acyl-CoA dehydrogenase
MRSDHLDWPFFDDSHRAWAAEVDRYCADRQAHVHPVARDDVDRACRAEVRAMGAAGLLRQCVPRAAGGARPDVDSRALCIARERLAYDDGLADFAFAMQGLGSGAIALAGGDAERARWLPAVAAGRAIAAFALTEPRAGSDVAALAMSARRDGGDYVLDGEKTWISNGGIADFYCVFARTPGTAGSTGISAFVVPADLRGVAIVERLDAIAPHPLAHLALRDVRVPATAMLGAEGDGFKLAMRTLDIFRASVAAAAVGMARRAFDAAVAHARSRAMFGGMLGDLQLTQAALGDMATAIDRAALLVYRAAWLRDVKGVRTTREAAMAKLEATESAQRVIDAALQMHGGEGVRQGGVCERLYRDIRALRIYEGASEVQRLVIGRDVLRPAQAGRA